MQRKPKNKSIPNELINFYELPQAQENLHQHFNPNFSLTQIKIPCRMGVVALSGGGKTNFIMNFIRLTSRGEGTFSHIHVVHKIPEDLYDYLEKLCGDQITFYKKLADQGWSNPKITKIGV